MTTLQRKRHIVGQKTILPECIPPPGLPPDQFLVFKNRMVTATLASEATILTTTLNQEKRNGYAKFATNSCS